MRRSPLALALLVGAGLLGACGGGDAEVTGQVSDVDGRLCVSTTTFASTCMSATDEQLGSVQPGQCVRIAYTGGGGGAAARVSSIEPADSPCVTPES